MFEYFKNNYPWSLSINLALMAGADIGQIDRALCHLQDRDAQPEDWERAWAKLADSQRQVAEADLLNDSSEAASVRFRRTSLYYLMGERHVPPGPHKAHLYQLALDTFDQFRQTAPVPVAKVDIPSPDGPLPAYIVPSTATSAKAPVVVMYNGFDVTKEILYGIVTDMFARRGMTCILVDAPGTGEPLRLRNVSSRPDYEVPTAAIVDWIRGRGDMDEEKICLVGFSMGGYYAPRGAAFCPQIKACVAWGGIWDYGQNWKDRIAQENVNTPVPRWQLPWVMGCDTLEAGLKRLGAWTLEPALPHLHQPFLIVHGEGDRGIPLADAQRALDAAASPDKQLKIFNGVDGGREHVGVDDPEPWRQFVARWIQRHLISREG